MDVPEHVVQDGFVHFLNKRPDGEWWVTTRKDGMAYSGMPLDHFLAMEPDE